MVGLRGGGVAVLVRVGSDRDSGWWCFCGGKARR